MATPLRYIGFSGGGWNTHTVSSGMMSGALQMARQRGASNSDFGVILNNFDGAAGNSGGSWFLTMLSYSPGFADALANQADDWFTTGYMGQQRKIFQPNSLEVKDLIKSALKAYLAQSIDSNPIYTELKNIPLLGTLAANEFKKSALSINNSIVDIVIDNIDAGDALKKQWNEYGLYPMLLYYANKFDFNWLELVRNTAYQPYEMSTILSQGFNTVNRNNWASNLKLVLPGAFDTSDVASYLQLGSLNPSYYSTSAEAINPELPRGQFITPARIVVGPRSNPTNNLKISGSAFTQTFQQNSLLGSLFNNSATAILGQEYTSELSIIEAATLSGAFAGDFSSIQTWKNTISPGIDKLRSSLTDQTGSIFSWVPNFWPFYLRDTAVNQVNDFINNSFDSVIKPLALNLAPMAALFAKDLAVPVSLRDQVARYQNPQDTFNSLSDLTTSQNYRFIDGGYVDNTTVASIISEIQSEHGIEKNFDLTFFVNNTDKGIVPKEFTGNENDFIVPIDLAKLFGGQTDLSSWQFDGQLRLGPSNTEAAMPYIFNRAAWMGEKPVWEWNNSDEWKDDPSKTTYLAYYKLDVETINNPFFSIKEKQRGEINIFTSYNLSSGPGPYDPSFFDIYENIYKATREGIINQGGYVHLLSAMNIMEIRADEDKSLTFASDEGLTHLVQLDFEGVDTDYASHIDIYKVTAEGERVYSGSIGGSAQERSYTYDHRPEAILMEDGDSLEFEISEKNLLDSIEATIELNEVDSGYQITGFVGSRPLFSAQASFAPVINGEDSVDDDPTPRDSADDTYFFFNSGDSVKITVDVIASFTNRLSIIKVDRDPITGEITYLGRKIDSSGMNELLESTFGNQVSSSNFEAQQLSPFSKSEFDWQVEEDGYFAPVLLTEEGYHFTLGHDLSGGTTRSRLIGDYTVGFEDKFINSDFDYNDAIVRFEVLT